MLGHLGLVRQARKGVDPATWRHAQLRVLLHLRAHEHDVPGHVQRGEERLPAAQQDLPLLYAVPRAQHPDHAPAVHALQRHVLGHALQGLQDGKPKRLKLLDLLHLGLLGAFLCQVLAPTRVEGANQFSLEVLGLLRGKGAGGIVRTSYSPAPGRGRGGGLRAWQLWRGSLAHRLVRLPGPPLALGRAVRRTTARAAQQCVRTPALQACNRGLAWSAAATTTAYQAAVRIAGSLRGPSCRCGPSVA
mmetsp:Transcript_29651/g.80157  ORF Transcript_29651/g.80157 Transcript_29651/m.80157 type:complete len:246 (-) Transcript_29651:60-797(-)